MKRILAATGLALLLAAPASAATLGGSFTIDIYNYNSGGNQSNADATDANVTTYSSGYVGSVTYTGLIDFFTSTGTTPFISEFLNSGTGSYIGAFTDMVMSTGGFTTTTLLDIYGTFASDTTGVISHDDGVSLYDTTGLVLDSSSPTVSIDSVFAAKAGGFRLIYSAANGNPEELNIDVAAVPVPAAGVLLLGGLGALAAAKRRRKAA